MTVADARASMPPAAEPARKAPSDTSGATTGNPALPAMPNPSSTMLPVMFAVKAPEAEVADGIDEPGGER